MTEAAKWTDYYARLDPLMAPNEYLLKMLLGRYAGKVDLLGSASWRTAFQGRRVLDMSCGDGRNAVLLHKLGFDISATEISAEICDRVHRNLANAGIELPRDRLRTGSNAAVPFDPASFDFAQDLAVGETLFLFRRPSVAELPPVEAARPPLVNGPFLKCVGAEAADPVHPDPGKTDLHLTGDPDLVRSDQYLAHCELLV